MVVDKDASQELRVQSKNRQELQYRAMEMFLCLEQEYKNQTSPVDHPQQAISRCTAIHGRGSPSTKVGVETQKHTIRITYCLNL